MLPASSVGSLSSITTTSVASSDDPRGDDDGGSKDFADEKITKSSNGVPGLKIEEWWKTTLQVSIPFMVAGIGTIGAGVILGRVEVELLTFEFQSFQKEQTVWSAVI